MPYVASQPDRQTFVVELRDVVTAGFEDGFSADPRNPIAAVRVENAPGRSTARTVARVQPHARSSRCVRAFAAPATSFTSKPIASMPRAASRAGTINLARTVDGDP